MKTKNYLLAALCLGAFALTSCSDDDTPDLGGDRENPVIDNRWSGVQAEMWDVADQYINGVVYPTYKNLAASADDLYQEAVNVKSKFEAGTLTDADVEAACDAFKTAREYWEKSEAFLFGPVADFSLDPSMDSWPLSVQDIKQILASGETPQSEDVKGYHSLEYLLFSDGESRNVTSDEEYNANPAGWRTYMQKVAQLLKEDGQAAYDWWFTTPYEQYGNKTFSEYFANTYQNPVGQIIEGCWDISGEVGDAKIGDPFNYWKDGQHEAALYAVESWYSWHSRDDYMNNIRSIKYSYLGNRTEIGAEASENSISNLVRRKLGSDYDNNMRKLINDAMNAINNIPQPFRNNIYTDESYTAMDACSKLTQGLKDMQASLGLN